MCAYASYDSRVYYKYLSRKTTPFSCPHCSVRLLPKEYERHCLEIHGLNPKTCCVWCAGVQEWPFGAKYRHVNHLRDCSDKFIRERCARPVARIPLVPQPVHLLEIPEAPLEALAPQPEALQDIPDVSLEALVETATPSSHDPPRLPSMTPFCPALDFFGHPSQFIRENLPPYALQHFWLVELEQPFHLFSDPSVNLAASYMRHYIDTRETHDWFHVMVKAVSFESFYEALDEDRGTTRTLAFSCWCDGGSYDEERHRQHRHMIVVSPKGHFLPNVWSKVWTDDRPRANFPCKGYREIETPRHLLNELGYVSKRPSQCHFSFNETQQELPEKNNHFHIFNTMPVGYRKCLAVQYDEGITDLLYQERLQNVSVNLLAETPLVRENNQWKQKIGDFYALPRHIVLPVKKGLMPTQKVTPDFVYSTKGRKLYFQYNAIHEHLNEADWLRKQIEGGNSFYDAVENDWWTPRPKLQAELNNLRPRVERIRRYETEILRLRRQLEEKETRHEEEVARLTHMNHLKDEEIKRLQSRLEQALNFAEKQL